MAKDISNEEYEKALKNMDNKLIMEKACSSFRNVIDNDELHRCKLIALWESLIYWKPGGRKFTSFLYQRVNWECLKVVRSKKKTYYLSDKIDKAAKPNIDVCEIVESLPSDLKDMVIKRYIHKMTLREISEIYGFCHETVRRKINKAIKIVRKT